MIKKKKKKKKKNLPARAGHSGSIPESGRSPGEGNATHSCILAWRIPWTEEPGGLQAVESQKKKNLDTTEQLNNTHIINYRNGICGFDSQPIHSTLECGRSASRPPAPGWGPSGSPPVRGPPAMS